MSSSDQLLRFAITSDPAVRITVYNAIGTKLGTGDGTITLSLTRGLYRVHLNRYGVVRELLVEHNQETTLHDDGPPLQTPVPLTGDASSHDYREPARKFSLSDTCPPIGNGPHAGRLFVFIRRKASKIGPTNVPSEQVSIHDLRGHKLVALCHDVVKRDNEIGYVAFSARVTPGTYRIRAVRSCRELAITIPEGRAAQVFVADSGAVRLDDIRVSLTEFDCPFDPDSRVAQAMEGVLAALRSPEPSFPADARLLLPLAVEQDLCFGIASAHQLWRCEDIAAFDQVVQRLSRYSNIPDIAILGQLRQSFPVMTQPPFVAPPLMRASFVMAMARPESALSTISPNSIIARAARTDFHDSIWFTWSGRSCCSSSVYAGSVDGRCLGFAQ